MSSMTRLKLDIVRTEAGRLRGRLITDDGATDVRFNGTLELLRLFEQIVTDEDREQDACEERRQ
jgi:hypothetical protein